MPAHEPLSDEGWGQVGGVAEEKDVAVAPVVGQLRAEVVLRDAHKVQPVARDPLDPGSDQGLDGLDGLEVSGGLAVQEAELPAVAGLADAHVGRGALGVAQLVDTFPLVELDLAVDVDDQPALLEVEVFHGRADRRAHHTVGSVTAQDVGGQHGLGLGGEPVGEVHPDPALAVLGDIGDLDVGAQGDRGLVLEVGAEQVLELGLVEHVRLWVAVPTLVAGPVEHREHPVVAVDQLQSAGGPGDGARTARRCRAVPGPGRSRRRGARPAVGGRRRPSGPGRGTRRRTAPAGWRR